MSQISSIFGTDDDEEIVTALYTIANVRSISLSHICPSVATAAAFLITLAEYCGTWLDTREPVNLQCDRLYATVVRVGEQLLCGDAVRSCTAQARSHIQDESEL